MEQRYQNGLGSDPAGERDPLFNETPQGQGNTGWRKPERITMGTILGIVTLIVAVVGVMNVFWGNIDDQIEREIGQLEERTTERIDRMEKHLGEDIQGLRTEFSQLNATLMNILTLNREVGTSKREQPQDTPSP